MKKIKVLPRSLRVISTVLIFAQFMGGMLVQVRAQTPATTDSATSSAPAPIHFSDNPTNDEITQARIFPEPIVPGSAVTGLDNSALARALEQFAARQDATDVSAIVGFLQNNPSSGWETSLLTNLGILYFKTGNFSKAMAAWEQAWQAGKEETQPQIRMVADRAAGELAKLNARLGRIDRIETLLAETEGRVITGPATELINQAAEGVWLMKNRPERAFLCGPAAVGTLFRRQTPGKSTDSRIENTPSTKNGTSLTQVNNLASAVGLNLQMARRDPGAAVIVPAIVNWKVGHYAALVERSGQASLIEDPTFGERIWIKDSALDEEVSGYFLVPSGPLPAGWYPVDRDEGDQVWGKGTTGSTDPNASKPSDKKIPACRTCDCPMAVASAHLAIVSLNIVDTPFYYSTPRGPGVRFQLTYNQRDANQPTTFSYCNLGPKWTFNWLSYVVDDPVHVGADATLYVRGGGAQTYTGYNSTTQSYAPQLYDQSVLVHTSASSYERQLPDGSKEIFDVSDGVTVAGRKIFLRQIVDPFGNTLTFSIDSQLRITTVTDSLGQVVTLHYPATGDTRKLTSITDTQGRSCSFTYTADGHLATISDMISIVSQFTYNGDFIQTLTTPYGTSSFDYGDLSTDPRLNARTRWLELTDPKGAKERVEYNELITALPNSDPVALLPTGIYLRNGYLYSRNTYYWDKKTMMEGPPDYSKAQIYHWLHAEADTLYSGSILESEKRPLENRVWYNYPGQNLDPNDPDRNGAVFPGTQNKPSAMGRVLADGTTQLATKEYNVLGNVTKEVDPKGRVTTYTYAANNIDLLAIYQQNPAGVSVDSYGVNADQLSAATYNAQHLPLTMTDAAGQVTTYTYNGAGQPLTRTVVRNGQNETTTLSYDASGYLQSITGPVAGSSLGFTYDTHGRVKTLTDSETYQLTYEYDSLDRVTQVTYPDATFEQTTYFRLDPQWQRDRLGRRTHFFYDSVRRLAMVQDSVGRTIHYDWCKCGALDALIDAANHTTHFDYDIEGRLVQKTYDDGRALASTYEAGSGRLVANSLIALDGTVKRVKHYQYDLDEQISQVSYTDGAGAALSPPTPTVNFAYDSIYPRLSTMTTGTDVTAYGYYPVAVGTLGGGRLSSVDGPLANDTITYSYDELGRVTSRAINGVADGLTFDALGRITGASNPLGSFVYGYLRQTSRINSVTYPNPNGQTTSYSYFSGTADPNLQTIWHTLAGGTTLSKFDYGYNAVGDIMSWQQQADANPVVEDDFGYDGIDQLLTATRKDVTSGTVQKQGTYAYDLGGNRTLEQVNAALASATYNNVNQLTGRSGAGPMTFEGTLDEPATVTVGGNAAKVTALGGTPPAWKFQGTATVSPGAQSVAIVATDADGNVTSQHAQVNVTAGTASQSFTYDDDGNLLSDGTRTFVWDAENRLVKVTIGTDYQEFVYNGVGQRVAEKMNGALTKQFVWDGSQLREERDASNNVTKRFYGQGEQIGGTSYYFSRDHLGSIREMTDGTDVIRARYDYDAWGRRSKLSGDLDADFGFTGDYWDAFASINLTYFRAYDPELGRWLSRDPMKERSGSNLYEYVKNAPVRWKDPIGLDIWIEHAGLHQNISIGDPNGDHSSFTFGIENRWSIFNPLRMGTIYPDERETTPDPGYGSLQTTLEEDKEALNILNQMLWQQARYGLIGSSCRNFSQDMFDYFKDRYPNRFIPPTPPRYGPYSPSNGLWPQGY